MSNRAVNFYVGNVSYREGAESWAGQAACRDTDHEVFDLTCDDDFYEGRLSAVEWFAAQAERMKAPEAICKACPVLKECKADCGPEDHSWSYRAGLSPLGEQYARTTWRNLISSKDLPSVEREILESSEIMCRRGLHRVTPDNSIKYGTAKVRCRPCDTD